jgi:hypothetical protein
MRCWKFFALAFVFSFLLVANVFAVSDLDSLADSANSAKDTLDNVNDIVSSPDKGDVATNYLKQEWGKILRDKPLIGEFLRGYDSLSPYTDPVAKWAIGLIPSFSWIFILTFLIWFTLLRYSNLFFDFLKDLDVFSKSTTNIVYFCVVVIILVLQIVQAISVMLANLIVNFFSEFLFTWWGQILVIVGTILILTLLNMFNKRFRVYLRAIRMKKYQEKVKKAADKIDKS